MSQGLDLPTTGSLYGGLGIPRRFARPKTDRLPSPLEPSRRTQNCNGLIHDPFADAEVGIDPALDVLVLGDLV